jgi:Tripartite tricarboxylate transporter family receptor
MRIVAPVLVALVLACGSVVPGRAETPDYPNGKITFIVGFAPGGGIDTYARVLAQALTEQFGYSIVIENRPGAASNIAARAVAAAPANGHTLLFTGNSYAINQTFYKNAGYANSDLRPVAFVAIDSQGLTVSAANPARSLPAFLDAGKTTPFTFGYGGSSAHIVSTSSRCSPRAMRPECRSRAARPRSVRCSAAMSIFSPPPSPRCIRRSRRARCGCWRSPVRAGQPRSRTRRRSTRWDCRVSASTAGSAFWHRPRPDRDLRQAQCRSEPGRGST